MGRLFRVSPTAGSFVRLITVYHHGLFLTDHNSDEVGGYNRRGYSSRPSGPLIVPTRSLFIGKIKTVPL
ncbi:unnamed protein product [Nesidiocoris tenuis]|uniref:Uncharacterized protein n=1 Tax=Nesidiocoris tenuis TaxID=355587 RepID=A0A6H5GRF1_9HEMI|nr:unnamed protein product [Nesidiocoris tenuis]